MILIIFSCFIDHLYIFGEIAFQVLCQVLKEIVFILFNFMLLFSIFWVLLPYQTEKAMAIHSSTLTRKIPWTEEPGRLQSVGSLRVEHD